MIRPKEEAGWCKKSRPWYLLTADIPSNTSTIFHWSHEPPWHRMRPLYQSVNIMQGLLGTTTWLAGNKVCNKQSRQTINKTQTKRCFLGFPWILYSWLLCQNSTKMRHRSELGPAALRQLPMDQGPPILYLPFIPLLLVLGSTIISVMMLDRKVLDGFPDSEESPVPHCFAKHHSKQDKGKERKKSLRDRQHSPACWDHWCSLSQWGDRCCC